jgi:hypothetical protein
MVVEGILVILMLLIWDKSWNITIGLGVTVGMLFVIDIFRTIVLRNERR